MSVKYNFFEFILEETTKGPLNIDKDRCIELINAIAINFVLLIILYVGNNPPIPEIALIT